ncbi:MAG: serine hydrolase [Chitinophagaceae bacterium]|nr:serine hydrolase [Chitinophagaceae bacterium]
MLKNYKSILWIIVLGLVSYGTYFAWGAFPGISGFGAKNLCSCLFVAGRDEKSVRENELSANFIKFGTFTVNKEDSSVTGSVIGLAKRKAIYRKGLGCTLVNDIAEKDLRSQHFITASVPEINRDAIPWPQGDLIQDTKSAGVDSVQLGQAIKNVFSEPVPKKKIGTRAVVILYDGKLVAEYYAAGFNRSSRMIAWSATKSITAALIGILVKGGKLNTEEFAPVSNWKDSNDPRHKIRLEHLLQQTSGLSFTEAYSKPSEVITMLFSKGDMAGYTSSLVLKDTPGTVFNYSSGNSNILQGLIRQIVGERYYHQFPYDSLFHKIGIYSALLEPDASGTFVGSSYMFASARDLARFGLLYYNDGVFNGERILPAGWVKKSRTSFLADKLKRYGYQFWLNGFNKRDLSKKWYPDVPADMFFADGFGGQEVYIIPSKKLIAVRLGLNGFDENKFLKEVIAALPE